MANVPHKHDRARITGRCLLYSLNRSVQLNYAGLSHNVFSDTQPTFRSFLPYFTLFYGLVITMKKGECEKMSSACKSQHADRKPKVKLERSGRGDDDVD